MPSSIALIDETRDRYALMQIGWDRGRRVRDNLIYLTLREGKVYVEYDSMESGITQDLIERRIPTNHIVLAFLPEDYQTIITNSTGSLSSKQS